jgi:hypothetical protein
VSDKPRTDAEYLKVKMWFEEVKHLMDCSTYQVERHFMLNTSFSSKWKNYKIGRHTPQRTLVDRVGDKLPETKRILNHPLWELIDTERIESKHLHELIYKIDPVIALELNKNIQDNSGSFVLKRLHNSTFQRLLKLANLDVLAMLLVFWEIEDAQDDKCLYARYAYKVLLTVGVFLFLKNMRAIALELFELLNARLFARTKWPADCSSLADVQKYERHVDVLIRIYHTNDWVIKYPSINQKSARFINLLNGQYGLEAPIFFCIHGSF